MELIKYCSIEGGNFGDDINLKLWDKLFPNLIELTGRVFIYGVGTLLDGSHDQTVMKVVLGAGIGEHNVAIPGANWDFRWVRGPMTAREFSLPSANGLGDPAILWPGMVGAGHDEQGPVGLIPHYATWDSFDWSAVASRAGMLAINPRLPPDTVFANMRRCSRILSESLHGAICADAMGIPWASCVLAHRFNEFKWRDWLATIQRPYAPLVMSRPLVRKVSYFKGSANCLAKLIQYQRRTRSPFLRPTRAASSADVLNVVQALREYGKDSRNFTCSDRGLIEGQKSSMLRRCSSFADEYGLQFTP